MACCVASILLPVNVPPRLLSTSSLWRKTPALALVRLGATRTPAPRDRIVVKEEFHLFNLVKELKLAHPVQAHEKRMASACLCLKVESKDGGRTVQPRLSAGPRRGSH